MTSRATNWVATDLVLPWDVDPWREKIYTHTT